MPVPIDFPREKHNNPQDNKQTYASYRQCDIFQLEHYVKEYIKHAKHSCWSACLHFVFEDTMGVCCDQADGCGAGDQVGDAEIDLFGD